MQWVVMHQHSKGCLDSVISGCGGRAQVAAHQFSRCSFSFFSFPHNTPFFRSLRNSSIHSAIHSAIHSFILQFIHSAIHSFCNSFILQFIHSFIHSAIHFTRAAKRKEGDQQKKRDPQRSTIFRVRQNTTANNKARERRHQSTAIAEIKWNAVSESESENEKKRERGERKVAQRSDVIKQGALDGV